MMDMTTLVLLSMTLLSQTNGSPVRHNIIKRETNKAKQQNYYVFWKVLKTRLIPQTDLLQKEVADMFNDMCAVEKYGRNDAGVDCWQFAINEAERLNLPQSPENNVLSTKNSKKFMQRLVKSTVRILAMYSQSLPMISAEYLDEINCTTLTDACAWRITSVERNLKELTKDLYEEMKNFFGIKKDLSRLQPENLFKDNPTPGEQMALLYSLSVELIETKAALEYVVQTTWDIHILKASGLKRKLKMVSIKDSLGL
ncbi:hypothetical protein SNE40_022553 [Patella caerulea]